MVYHERYDEPGMIHATKSHMVKEAGTVGDDHPLMTHFRANYPITDDMLDALRQIKDGEQGNDHPLMQHFKETYPVRDATLQALRATMKAD